jgi:surfactin synthase thioesterase subunit
VKWKELTNAAFEMHILDGGHFLPPPSVSKLIQLISHQLQSAGWV